MEKMEWLVFQHVLPRYDVYGWNHKGKFVNQTSNTYRNDCKEMAVRHQQDPMVFFQVYRQNFAILNFVQKKKMNEIIVGYYKDCILIEIKLQLHKYNSKQDYLVHMKKK